MQEGNTFSSFVKFPYGDYWQLWNKPNDTHLFLYLLTHCNINNRVWNGTEIKRGQIVTSLEKLSFVTGLSVQQARTSIARLIATNLITSRATNKYRIITICNYDNYNGYKDGCQQAEQQAEQQGLQQATNKQLNNNNRIIENRTIENTPQPPKGECGSNDEILSYIISQQVAEPNIVCSAYRLYIENRKDIKNWKAYFPKWYEYTYTPQRQKGIMAEQDAIISRQSGQKAIQNFAYNNAHKASREAAMCEFDEWLKAKGYRTPTDAIIAEYKEECIKQGNINTAS